VAAVLGSVRSCTRGLFWRWCCPNLNHVNTFWSVGPVSELFDTPTYVEEECVERNKLTPSGITHSVNLHK
jgi:hypothetical protein